MRCVAGNLEIRGVFDDLGPLAALEEVSGLLVTAEEYTLFGFPSDYDPPIGPRTLIGLGSLRSVGGLWIHGNQLEGLEGLEGLEEIGESGLWIEDPGVADLTPLGGLEALDGFLWIGNARPMLALESLAPLAGIHQLNAPWDPKALSLRRTGLHDLAGLEGLVAAQGVIDIGLNPNLTSVDALGGAAATGYMIYANPALSECAAHMVVPPGVPTRVVGNLDDGCAPPTICEPFDAFVEGPCEAFSPGIRWNGAKCEYLGSGCKSLGAELPLARSWHSLYMDIADFAACEAAFAGC
ncbi:MAG: hypothetical protein H6710_01115 [Myxococcales bacterium]|nr:hypothetical protein [Myxococcales bacterium]